MGAGCSHPVEFIAYAATSDEVRDAVKSIEAWQKAQEDGRTGKGFQHTADTKSPLLARVGGNDNVKRVVEGFYRRLYADERMTKYLSGFEMPYLRAKQSAFMSWLFGPANVPYGGKHLRTVHLKMIKLQGFSPEDFEVGMDYFAEAMKELGAPETIISEVMSKIRPFKDVIFTPNTKDDEEIARWAAEGYAKQAAAASGKPAEKPAAQADNAPGTVQSAQAPTAVATAAPTVAADRPASAASTASARARQCPFSGAMVGASSSKPSSPPASVAAAAPPPAPAPAPAPVPDPVPPPAAASSRPASSAPAPAAAAAAAAGGAGSRLASGAPAPAVPPAEPQPAPLQKEKSQPSLMKATTTELVDAFISEAIAEPPAPAAAAAAAPRLAAVAEEEEAPVAAEPAAAEPGKAGAGVLDDLDGLEGLEGLAGFGLELGDSAAAAAAADGAGAGGAGGTAGDEAGAQQPPAATLSQALGQLDSSQQLGEVF